MNPNRFHRRAGALVGALAVTVVLAACEVVPPTTTVAPAPTTTAAPAPTTTPTTAAPTTTAKPTTTTAPTTTVAPSVGAASLDPSGKTIPASNYSIPAGAIFMSPTGNDANPGTQSAPVKTLNRAIPLVPASGTLVLRGGEHRDWYNVNNAIRHINKSITIQGFPGEQAWLSGADVIADGWAQAGTVWSRAWSTPQFCAGQYDVAVDGLPPFSHKLTRNTTCTWADTVRDPQYPVAGDPQLAFANGAQLRQVGTLAEVTPGSKTFFYDWNAKRIYISESPSANRIELATRPGAFVLGGTYDFVLRGVGVRRYASAIMGNTGATAVYVGLGNAGSPGSVKVENVVFAENAGATLSLSGPKPGSYVKNSVFAQNHAGGLHGNGFARTNPGSPNDLLIEGSRFSGNNVSMADTMCNASCGVAAVKLNNMVGFTSRNNIFEDTKARAFGMWCDMDCSRGVIVNNVSRNNGGHGIFYEISNTGIIANNLVYHNESAGIAVAAANTKVYNNTVINKPGPRVQAFWIFDDSRTAPDKGETWPYTNPQIGLGPNTNNTQFANNLVVAQQPNGARLMNFLDGTTVAPNTQSNEYFSVLDHNIYYSLSGQNLYGWGDTDAIKSPAQLRTVSGQNWETQTTHVVGSGDPFVNRAALDFTIRSNSEVASSVGRPLPADVAAATGLPMTPRRGAYLR